VYGWTTNPLVEYYVVENYGTHAPFDTPEAEFKPNITTDGDSYIVFTKMRVDKPSIVGTATFAQYFSVRNTRRTAGTITLANHFAGWEAAGLKLGAFRGQILATEGQGSNGTAEIDVW